MVTGCAADLVRVWCIRTDIPDDVTSRLADLLDDEESRRAAGFASSHIRRRFIAAHGAARLILGGQLDLPPESIRWAQGPHGKPALAGPEASGGASGRAGPGAGAEISLSHSGEFAMLALARGRRVGIDIEESMTKVDMTRIAERYYPATEAAFVRESPSAAERARRFVRLWTRKEACVKVEGGQLVPGLLLPVAGPSPVLVAAADPAGKPLLVRDIPAPDGFCASVAAEGGAPYQLLCRWWPDDAGDPRQLEPRRCDPRA